MINDLVDTSDRVIDCFVDARVVFSDLISESMGRVSLLPVVKI